MLKIIDWPRRQNRYNGANLSTLEEQRMAQRWMVVAIVLLVAVPSTLYARWIKDKVYLETKEVGKVEFSHFSHL